MILYEKIKKTDCIRKTSSIFIGKILNFDIYDTKTEYFILKYILYRYLHVYQFLFVHFTSSCFMLDMYHIK